MTSSLSMNVDELRNRIRVLIGDLLTGDMDYFRSEEGKKFLNNLKVIHNKLAMVELTQERHFLSVTGLQGAGKTTLMKWLYDIEDSYFPDNLGRGEQLPIIITEKAGITQPVARVCKIEQDQGSQVHLKQEDVLSEVFYKKALEPDTEDVWLELDVPFRYLHNEKKSIVLLPGFEKDRSQRSQMYLEHFLRISISSIVVFRKDTYARQNSDDMFRRVQKLYDEVKPIFVLSRGDVNPEQNEEQRQQVIRDFRLPPQDEDRVVVTGDPNYFTSSWKSELMKAIAQYSSLDQEGEQLKLELLENLCGEISDYINTVEEEINKQEAKRIISDNNIGLDNEFRVINSFEMMYTKRLRELEIDLKEKLGKRVDDATKQFNSYVKENFGFWSELISSFSPNALEQQEKLEMELRKVWIHSASQEPELDMATIIEHHIDEEKTKLKLNFESSAVAVSTPDKWDSFTRIEKFFGENSNDHYVSLKREDLMTLTLIGTTLALQSLVAQPILQNFDNEEYVEMALNFKSTDNNVQKPFQKSIDDMQSFAAHMKKLEGITPLILKSIPLILGVDIALDGESDIINNAVKALAGIGITVAPAALLGIIGAGFAFTYAVNAIQKATHETNQRQLQVASAGRRTLGMLPELQAQAFIASLRRIFEKMADRLAEKHRERTGQYENDGKLAQIQYSLPHIRRLNNGILKELYVKRPDVFV